MVNLISKFLKLGMSVQDVIAQTTWNPVRAIHREDLGHLSIGTEADIAVFNLREGDFGFLDSRRRAIGGTQKMEVELTMRAGNVVWDQNGIASLPWTE